MYTCIQYNTTGQYRSYQRDPPCRPSVPLHCYDKFSRKQANLKEFAKWDAGVSVAFGEMPKAIYTVQSPIAKGDGETKKAKMSSVSSFTYKKQ